MWVWTLYWLGAGIGALAAIVWVLFRYFIPTVVIGVIDDPGIARSMARCETGDPGWLEGRGREGGREAARVNHVYAGQSSNSPRVLTFHVGPEPIRRL